MAAVAALFFLANAASALTYNWSFDAVDGTSEGIVAGTISGLQIGSNDGSGLTIEILQSTNVDVPVLGGGWVFDDTSLGGDAFTIETDKSVSFADALFRRTSPVSLIPNDELAFGGYGGYFPLLFSEFSNDGPVGFTVNVGFPGKTAFELSTVPLPAGLPLFLSGFVGFAGLRMLRRNAKRV